jgi:hypothetical protein
VNRGAGAPQRRPGWVQTQATSTSPLSSTSAVQTTKTSSRPPPKTTAACRGPHSHSLRRLERGDCHRRAWRDQQTGAEAVQGPPACRCSRSVSMRASAVPCTHRPRWLVAGAQWPAQIGAPPPPEHGNLWKPLRIDPNPQNKLPPAKSRSAAPAVHMAPLKAQAYQNGHCKNTTELKLSSYEGWIRSYTPH